MRGIEFPNGVLILDEGVIEGFVDRLDFVGPDVSIIVTGNLATIAIAAAPATIEILDESVSQGFADQLNFTGIGVSATVVGTLATINVPGTFVSDEGTPQGEVLTFDFVGAGVGAVVAAGVATITIPAAPNTIATQDEGTPLGASTTLNFVGAGVTASFAAGTTTVTVPGSAGGLTLTTVEQDLGSVARTSGNFSIAGAGLTPGDPVLIQKAAGPYTGKGTLADETEMDIVQPTAIVESATVIRVYWTSATPVKGNFKFDYAIG